ncbi:MAG TPA: LytR C-terminal domain-containing protein [bacterium]|nr:LytR C-terminal domain-containing protein [bacterium]HOR57667.1 LytR C-terminal domain-containing protein [bacterium]HPL56430.1 LytR C-terminal domain-containing protein [bacterium]
MAKSIDIIKAPKQKPVSPKDIANNRRESDKGAFFDRPRHESKPDVLNYYLILAVCALLLLVVLAGWLIYKQLTSEGEVSQHEEITTTQEEPSNETAKINGDSSTKVTLNETPPATTPTTTQAPTVDKANTKVRVVNGNGRSGEAQLMKDTLKADGFTNITVGNALSRYATTVIYYNSGKLAEAQAVEKIVASKYQTSLLESPSVVKDNDVLVALGNK